MWRQFTFYHEVSRNSWYSLDRPRKDERLCRPWNHQVVLNTGSLDWESSALTMAFSKLRMNVLRNSKGKKEIIKKFKLKIFRNIYIVYFFDFIDK